MNVVRLIPVILSAFLLAAHFLRMESIPLVALALLVPFVLLIRRPWAARVVQIALMIGAIEWVRTLLMLVARRQAEGEPWTRLAVILGAVAVFTLASVLPFSSSKPIRRRYGLDAPDE